MTLLELYGRNSVIIILRIGNVIYGCGAKIGIQGQPGDFRVFHIKHRMNIL